MSTSPELDDIASITIESNEPIESSAVPCGYDLSMSDELSWYEFLQLTQQRPELGSLDPDVDREEALFSPPTPLEQPPPDPKTSLKLKQPPKLIMTEAEEPELTLREFLALQDEYLKASDRFKRMRKDYVKGQQESESVGGMRSWSSFVRSRADSDAENSVPTGRAARSNSVTSVTSTTSTSSFKLPSFSVFRSMYARKSPKKHSPTQTSSSVPGKSLDLTEALQMPKEAAWEVLHLESFNGKDPPTLVRARLVFGLDEILLEPSSQSPAAAETLSAGEGENVVSTLRHVFNVKTESHGLVWVAAPDKATYKSILAHIDKYLQD